MKTERCRRCNAKIVFLLTQKGRRMPVNAETARDGDVDVDLKRHTSHFATCPAANEFRRKSRPEI